jgi:hypothetical protein
MSSTNVVSYSRREWNDDDRVNDYISYHYDQSEVYVPVYKILKEMYDEEKANLYIYDVEEEYIYMYGTYYYEKYYEMLSDYYEIYSMSSVVDSDSENEEDDYITDEDKSNVSMKKDDDTIIDKVDEEETSMSTETNKFIYI